MQQYNSEYLTQQNRVCPLLSNMAQRHHIYEYLFMAQL